MKVYKGICRNKKCKAPFESFSHTQKYCEVCIEERASEKKRRGILVPIECAKCTKVFKPHHHAVKFCPECRKKPWKPNYDDTKDLVEYAKGVTRGGKDLIDLYSLVLKDRVVINNKGGRGKRATHVPCTIDQRMKAAAQLQLIVYGKPSTAPPQTVEPPETNYNLYKPEDEALEEFLETQKPEEPDGSTTD